MNVFSNLRAARDTVYNKVWHNPKGKLSAKVRGVCDGIPHKQRLMVVSVMLCAFVLIAFFVFVMPAIKSGWVIPAGLWRWSIYSRLKSTNPKSNR